MTRLISTTLFFLTVGFTSSLLGQGRVDTDPILHKIWWTTWKIDADRSLTCNIVSSNNQNNEIELLATYYGKDSLFKIIKLRKQNRGAQLTTYYFSEDKPIFISVRKNNYSLSSDKTKFEKAVLSFTDTTDSSDIRKKPQYKVNYQAEYFFYNGEVRYVNIMTDEFIRVDNKKDFIEGLQMYKEAQLLFKKRL
ncbi:MAG: hypothetical protein ACTHOF_05450 [Flavisolibacter sp.]